MSLFVAINWKGREPSADWDGEEREGKRDRERLVRHFTSVNPPLTAQFTKRAFPFTNTFDQAKTHSLNGYVFVVSKYFCSTAENRREFCPHNKFVMPTVFEILHSCRNLRRQASTQLTVHSSITAFEKKAPNEKSFRGEDSSIDLISRAEGNFFS